MQNMTEKEFFERTGITEGYGTEILKDAEHAAWHIPQGAGFITETTEEPEVEDVPVVEEPEVEDVPVVEEPEVEEDEDGGSVEGE